MYRFAFYSGQRSKPISTGRDLVPLDDKAYVSPNARARIVSTFLEKQRLYNIYRAVVIGSIVCFFGIASSSFLFLLIKGPQNSLGFLVFLFILGGAMLAIVGSWNWIQENILKLKFPCPFCQFETDVLAFWICGNCKSPNNSKYLGTLSTSFHRCSDKFCAEPEQTAYVCPHCQNHVYLNKARYKANKSHKLPFKGVANFGFSTQETKKENKQFFDE